MTNQCKVSEGRSEQLAIALADLRTDEQLTIRQPRPISSLALSGFPQRITEMRARDALERGATPALWQRFQRPLFALGVLWFFSGHLLTATVIPLMLAFEHRNYFPSAGLLLAAFSLLAIRRTRSRNGIVLIIVILLFAFYALTTSLRSAEWSSDLRLAASDAAKRPTSSAAQYEYARALLGSRLNGEAAPMQRKAIEVLEPMAANIEADAVHNQLLIVTSARLGMPIKDEWWDSLIAKLRSRQPTSMDGAALLALLECFDEKVCPQDIKHLGAAFAAATEHAGGYAPLLVAYGEFARDYLHDLNLAELEFRRAKKQSPTDAVARANLIALLISTGQLNDAQNELEELRSLNQFGSLDERIKALQELLDMKKPEVPGSRG